MKILISYKITKGTATMVCEIISGAGARKAPIIKESTLTTFLLASKICDIIKLFFSIKKTDYTAS
jgi:hypothetical protein